MSKNYFLLLTILSSILLNSQNVNIPDANLKYILTNTNCVDSDFDNSYDSSADINGDGEIQVSEAEAVKSLKLSLYNKKVLDITGLEEFSNLMFFSSSVEFYKTITNEQGLQVNIGVELLDFTLFEDLEKILIENLRTDLTKVNIKNLAKLKTFTAYNCFPTSSQSIPKLPLVINPEGCTSLNGVFLWQTNSDVYYCSAPSIEKISDSQAYISQNLDKNLDLACLPNLKSLSINGTSIDNLYLNNNIVLENFSYEDERSFNVKNLFIDKIKQEYDQVYDLAKYSDNLILYSKTSNTDNLSSVTGRVQGCTNGFSVNVLPYYTSFYVYDNEVLDMELYSNGTNNLYDFNLPNGSYKIIPKVSLSDALNFEQESFNVNFNTGGENFNQNLCVKPRYENVNGLSISLYPIRYDSLRENFEFFLTVTNNNESEFSGDIAISLDSDRIRLHDTYLDFESYRYGLYLNDVTLGANGGAKGGTFIMSYIHDNTTLETEFYLFEDELKMGVFVVDDVNNINEETTPDYVSTLFPNYNEQLLSNESFELVNNRSLNVYPNPVSNILNINSKDNLIKSIEIYNISGSLITKRISENKLNRKELDVSFLDSGLYFFYVKTENKTNVIKVIKK